MRPHLVVLVLFIAVPPSHAAERPIAEWLKDLDDPQSLVREEAIEIVTRAKAKDAVPKLTKLLDDPLPSVRRRSAIALWKIDGQTKPAIAALTATVRDVKAGQRREALLMLRDVAPPDEEYVPLLIALLEDRDPAIALQARGLLSFKADQAVPAVLAALPTAEPETRVRLIAFLGSLPPTKRSGLERTLRELMKNSDDRSRLAIIKLLQPPWGSPGDFFAGLAEIVAGKDPAAKVEAYQLALAAQPARKELVPVYRSALTEVEGSSRGRAIEALYELDASTLKETMPILIAMIKDGGTARGAAYGVLQRLGPAAKPALPAISELLATADENTGHDLAVFITTLSRMGPDALPALVKLMKHKNATIRNNAGSAVWLAGPAAVPHLIPLLKDEHTDARRAAFHAISLVGVAGQPVMPALIEGLRDADLPIRQYAVTTLLNLGPASKDAVGPLLEAMKDTSQPERNRAQVVKVLGRIGPDAKAAGPELRKLLNSDQSEMRVRAAEALWLIEGDRKEALPVLLNDLKKRREALTIPPNPILEFAVTAGVEPGEIIDALKTWSDKEPSLRRNIIMLLGKYYPNAKEAIPLLTTLLMEEDPFIRRLAATTLAHHGPAGKAAAPALAEVLKRQNYLDPPLLNAIGELGAGAAEMLPTLIETWKRPQAITVKPRLAATIVALDRDKGKEQLGYLHQQIKARGLPAARLAALAALAQVDPKNPDLVGALVEYARNPSRATSAPALSTLASMKADAKEALPAIRDQLKNDDPLVRLRAAEALGRVQGKPDDALPVLTTLLAERSDARTFAPVGTQSRWSIATEAAQHLGEIGPPAKASLPELSKCLSEPDDGLRRAAADAIKRINKH